MKHPVRLRIGALLLAAAAVLSSFCGCVKAPSEAASESGFTFTDDLGRLVTVPGEPRTAALIGSFADLWVLSGGTVCAAANDAWTQFGFPEDAGIVNIGSSKAPNLEQVLASEPQFVLASTNTRDDLDWEPIFSEAGIAVAYFDVTTFEDYLRLLQICTAINGKEERFEQYGTALQKTIDDALASAGSVSHSVLYLRVSASSIVAKNSHGSVLGEMLADFGCRNIADSDDALLETLSTERILLEDPECIFLVMQGNDTAALIKKWDSYMAEYPAWSALTAVQTGHVFFLDQALYNLKPNARWGEAYEGIAEILRSL